LRTTSLSATRRPQHARLPQAPAPPGGCWAARPAGRLRASPEGRPGIPPGTSIPRPPASPEIGHSSGGAFRFANLAPDGARPTTIRRGWSVGPEALRSILARCPSGSCRSGSVPRNPSGRGRLERRIEPVAPGQARFCGLSGPASIPPESAGWRWVESSEEPPGCRNPAWRESPIQSSPPLHKTGFPRATPPPPGSGEN